MRISKRLISVSMVLLASLCLGNNTFAQSANHITKVVTVGQDRVLEIKEGLSVVPEMVVELKDGLNEGDTFYLKLEGAEWEAENLPVVVSAPKEGQEQAVIVTKKIDNTQIEVKVTEASIAAGQSIRVPLVTKITGKEGKVVIDHNNTTLTSQEMIFAYASHDKGKVTISESSKIADRGVIPQIVIEEAYFEQFKGQVNQGDSLTLTLHLNNSDFAWDLSGDKQTTPALTGIKGYEGINGNGESFQINNKGDLEVKLPENIKTVEGMNKGGFTLEGIGIRSTVKQPGKQKITVDIAGDLIEDKTLQVLEVAEYEVILTYDKRYDVLSGKEQKIGFTLEESIEGTIVRDRAVEIVLTQGITVPVNQEENVVVQVEGKDYTFPAIKEEGKYIGFEIPKLDMPELENKLKHHFEFQIQIDSKVAGESKVIVSGRGLPEEIAVPIVRVTPSVGVKVEPMMVKAGLKGQKGGRIEITETRAGSLQQGEKILIYIDTETMKLAEIPTITVQSGDLQLGESKLVEDGIEIEVKHESNKPSVVVIQNFEVDVNGAVPDGGYEIAIGGKAISTFSAQTIDPQGNIDPIAREEFILVNVKPKDLKVIKFKMGEEAYSVNDKYYHLDVPAYVKNGRTMVPIKYLAESLGIPNEQVKWNKETQTISIYADKVIELEIDSTVMKVDGEKSYMATPAELVSGRTMVPVGEVARALGVEVEWDNKLQTATFIMR